MILKPRDDDDDDDTHEDITNVHETRAMLGSNYVLFSMHTLQCKKFNNDNYLRLIYTYYFNFKMFV